MKTIKPMLVANQCGHDRTRFVPSMFWILINVLAPSLLFAADQPNIVIFLADDHGWAHSEVYGNPDVQTPTMAALAREGMVFDAAFVASPACGPSRSALLSGLMPARNGAEENHQEPNAQSQTMVRHLKQAGYEVAAFGKVAHNAYGRFCGFDTLERLGRGEIGDGVEAFLQQRSSDKPLCLMVGDHRPHVPWTRSKTYDPKKITLPSWLVDTAETREHWARYLTDISGMDALMARVDAMAREHFGNDDYLFIYTADHGGQWPFGKWNLYDHGIKVPFIVRWPGRVEANRRTSAMVSWIDVFPTLIDLSGGTVPQDIDGKSFLPVLLGDSDAHREVIFTTTTADGPYNIYPIRSVRTQRFKYIRNIYPNAYHTNHSDILRRDGAGAYWDSWELAAKNDAAAKAMVDRYYRRPTVEFYDLQEDPEEQVNLADHPEHQAEISRLSNLIDDWMKRQGDTVKMQRKPYTDFLPTRENVPEIREREERQKRK